MCYIRRPGKNLKSTYIFYTVLFNKHEFKINQIVLEIDYGIQVIHCKENIKQYIKLKNRCDELTKSYSERPMEIINKMEKEGMLPLKQNIFKRVKTFMCIWWKLNDDKKNCYYDYFKLCKKGNI